ncbi:hypothetical protein MALU111345_00260 [Marinicrinis lubricantis]
MHRHIGRNKRIFLSLEKILHKHHTCVGFVKNSTAKAYYLFTCSVFRTERIVVIQAVKHHAS